MFQVAFVVRDVVLDEEAQRDRRVVADGAHRFEAFGRNAPDYGGQNFMLDLPPAKQRFPFHAGIAVGGDPCILSVSGAGVGAIDGCAHKALAIVGGRIAEVTHDLLARPSIRSPGNASELYGHGKQSGADDCEIGLKLRGNISH